MTEIEAEGLQRGSGSQQLDIRGRDKFFLGAAGVEDAGIGARRFNQDANVRALQSIAVGDRINFPRQLSSAYPCYGHIGLG